MIYSSKVQINAKPDVVWDLLTDARKWHEWEPNCTRIDGNIALGEQLKIHTKLSKRVFPAKVSQLEAPRWMVWAWAMPFGMFRGERTFRLTPHKGGTEVYCGEEFSGWMLFLFGRTIPDLAPAFRQFAAGLKLRVEA